MLRRAPTLKDGKVLNRLQESVRINSPFKPPSFTAVADRAQTIRKRKRVSYKEQQGDDSDSDEDCRKKKRKKDDKDAYHNEAELLAAVKKYPVFKPKPFNQCRRFSMPSMRNKDGENIPLFLPTSLSAPDHRRGSFRDRYTIRWKITPLYCTIRQSTIRKPTRNGERE